MGNTIMLRGIECIVLDCGSCGVPFTMPKLVYDQQVEEGGYHTCPNGHTRGWDKSNSQRERDRREQERLKQSVAQKDDEIRELNERVSTLVVTVATTKRETAKLKKRAAAGVCPCCNRTVRQMALHMKNKHPDYNVVPLKAEVA